MKTRATGAVIAGALLTGLLVGCADEVRSRSGGPLQPRTDPSVERQVDIYAAIIHRLVTVDHTFGDRDPGFGVIYVLDRTVGGAGDPEGGEEDGQPLSSEVQEGIRAAVNDLPPIEFVSDPDSVTGPLSEGNQVKNHGALVTLAPIPDGNDSVEVGASLYIANLAATWLTYVVDGSGGEWKVTGTTGPVAIS
jgi:hypothetical protein